MNDVDRELKEIQLKRERLALEREMALQGVATAAGRIAGGATAPFRWAARFTTTWWKAIAPLVVAALAVGGFATWKHEQDEKQKKADRVAKRKLWEEGQATFVLKQCPTERFECSAADVAKRALCERKTEFTDRYLCFRQTCGEGGYAQARIACELNARQEYINQNPQ
jgi:hypothetical protein